MNDRRNEILKLKKKNIRYTAFAVFVVCWCAFGVFISIQKDNELVVYFDAVLLVVNGWYLIAYYWPARKNINQALKELDE